MEPFKKPSGENETLFDLSSRKFSNDCRATDDEAVFSHARGLLSQLKYREAEEAAHAGLSQCTRRDRLCEVLGNIHLNQHRSVGIGWFMQSCLLGSASWVPYLLVSYAAKAAGLEELAWRCLNASDVLNGKRIDDLETSIDGIVRSSDRAELLVALDRFGKEMDSRLPSANEIPHDQNQRGIFLMQNINGNCEMPPLKQRIRLLGMRKEDRSQPNEPQDIGIKDAIDSLLNRYIEKDLRFDKFFFGKYHQYDLFSDGRFIELADQLPSRLDSLRSKPGTRILTEHMVNARIPNNYHSSRKVNNIEKRPDGRVVLSDDSDNVIVDKIYYEYLICRYPKATILFMGKSDPVLFLHQDEIRAILMPMTSET